MGRVPGLHLGGGGWPAQAEGVRWVRVGTDVENKSTCHVCVTSISGWGAGVRGSRPGTKATRSFCLRCCNEDAVGLALTRTPNHHGTPDTLSRSSQSHHWGGSCTPSLAPS